MNEGQFRTAFHALTGNDPFPWQWALFQRFEKGEIPESCYLPTGLGKTSVIAIWLIALAHTSGKLPRRLVYVVNRRTVVDQTTTEVENIRSPEKLRAAQIYERLRELCAIDLAADDSPLAVSTLRGQFADNREWSADPSRPAVICGTVDMIGSRLLFGGYGIGFKSKPLHAGFLGQDVLLVHDEAHLEPAFQKLILAIRDEQKRRAEFGAFRVMELSATSRGGGNVFELTKEERSGEVPVVRDRLFAKKGVKPIPWERTKLAAKIGDLALRHKDADKAVLVFVRTIDDVNSVRAVLTEKIKGVTEDRVGVLTGTLRGLERDQLATTDPIFARFLREPKVQPTRGTVYLVCTSAGEVGVDISADHMVSDLTTLDSVAQRFGRVNRRGGGAAEIDVVYEADPDPKKKDDPLEMARWETLARLRELPPCEWLEDRHEASPHDIGRLIRRLTDDERKSAFAPEPTTLPVTDILFDAWALTTINRPVVKEKLPGRPPVEPYLHGISDYDPPRTTIAWRREVALLSRAILERNKLEPEDILDLYPLKPHEELSGPTYGKNKVFEQLEEIAARDERRQPDERLSAWVIEPDGSVMIHPLAKIVEKDKQNKPLIALGGRTILLPPQAGGFSGGLLKGDEPFAEGIKYDVSDQWYVDRAKTIRRRWRGKSVDAEEQKQTQQMRLIRQIYIPAVGDDEDAEGWVWLWFTRPKSADDDGSKTAQEPVKWDDHTRQVTENATRIASALKLPAELQKALVLSAKLHDLGKKRAVWQRSIGHQLPKDPRPDEWLAKSGGKMMLREFTDYRHEFGSLLDLHQKSEFNDLKDSPELQDLILHLIAVHHGYGRPHFPEDRAFDPEPPTGINPDEIAAEVPRRFARLQRKYGRWGLAYLESLLRAADWAASTNPSVFVEDKR